MTTICSFVNPNFLENSKKITELGSGTFGSVALYETPIGKYVVKETKKTDQSAGYPPDFVTEVDALFKFRSISTIVRIDGVCFDSKQKRGFIILEPMETNLRRWYNDIIFEERLKAIPALISQIGGALAIIHKMGFVHGDIKNNNILANPNFQFKLADFGKCTYVTDPYCKYSAIARYRPYYNNTIFMEELYAFCVVLVETIIGENMIHCPDDLEEETIQGFYRKYGRKEFDIRRFLKDKLPRNQYKQIPDIFWDYVDPIFTFKDVTGVKLLKQVGLEISKETMNAVKNAVSSESRLHPNLEIVRSKAHRVIQRVDSRRAKRISDLYDRLMSKFLYTPEGMAVDRIREYSEIALIILLNKRYVRNRQNFFVNEEQLLLFQRSLIIALEYQTIVLP